MVVGILNNSSGVTRRPGHLVFVSLIMSQHTATISYHLCINRLSELNMKLFTPPLPAGIQAVIDRPILYW